MRKVTMKGKLTADQKRQHVAVRLKRGDISTIAAYTGYDQSHVSRVLRGERNNDSIINEAYKRFNKRKPVNA